MSFLPPTYRGSPNVGVDLISVTITDNLTQQSVAFGGRRSMFNATPKDELVTGAGMDQRGRVDHRYIPGGEQGTVTIERYNGDAMAVKKLLHANFYAGNPQRYYTITTKAVNTESDGSVDVDTYTYCVLSISQGQWSRIGKVDVTITWHAQECI